jgi:hypothetical protein
VNDSSTPIAPGNGPWRILILDRDADDPRWIIATVALPSDVRPAQLDPAGRYQDWHQIPLWLRELFGYDVELQPVHDPLAWRIDGRRPQ